MKPPRLCPLTASLCLLLVAAGSLNANPTYFNPTNPYSVTVNGSSTIFNTTAGFNGNRADFGGPWGSYYDNSVGRRESGPQSFSATFQADPGSVFTGVAMGFFLQWGFSSPESSYVVFQMDWSLPGSVYTGSNHNTLSGTGGELWTIGSGGGHYEWKHAGPQGGGGFEFMPIMDFPSVLQLNNVSSFDVSFSAEIFYGKEYFGDGTGAGIGFSAFSVQPFMTAGDPVDPPVSSVPDTGATAHFLGAGLFALFAAVRRQRFNQA